MTSKAHPSLDRRELSNPLVALVQLHKLRKRFGATLALDGVSFEVNRGETVGLVGANGAGKSTLIKILAGMEPATSGEILIEGQVRTIASPVQARDFGVVTVHQNIDDGVIFGMTVAENLLLDQLSVRAPHPFLTRRQIIRDARQILDELEIDLPLKSLVEDLPASGRQEVSIARALVKKPKLLILDEPTSTLSAREAERLFELGPIHAEARYFGSIRFASYERDRAPLSPRNCFAERQGRIVS